MKMNLKKLVLFGFVLISCLPKLSLAGEDKLGLGTSVIRKFYHPTLIYQDTQKYGEKNYGIKITLEDAEYQASLTFMGKLDENGEQILEHDIAALMYSGKLTMQAIGLDKSCRDSVIIETKDGPNKLLVMAWENQKPQLRIYGEADFLAMLKPNTYVEKIDTKVSKDEYFTPFCKNDPNSPFIIRHYKEGVTIIANVNEHSLELLPFDAAVYLEKGEKINIGGKFFVAKEEPLVLRVTYPAPQNVLTKKNETDF